MKQGGSGKRASTAVYAVGLGWPVEPVGLNWLEPDGPKGEKTGRGDIDAADALCICTTSCWKCTTSSRIFLISPRITWSTPRDIWSSVCALGVWGLLFWTFVFTAKVYLNWKLYLHICTWQNRPRPKSSSSTSTLPKSKVQCSHSSSVLPCPGSDKNNHQHPLVSVLNSSLIPGDKTETWIQTVFWNHQTSIWRRWKIWKGVCTTLMNHDIRLPTWSPFAGPWSCIHPWTNSSKEILRATTWRLYLNVSCQS